MYLSGGCRILGGVHTGETWRLGRRPGLDGLRGIAVLLVMLSHAVPDPFDAAGPIGVTVFFVLSGFLITSLLLEEHERGGRVSFGGFYARRARRLLPALVVMVAAVALASAFVSGLTTPGGVIAALFYFANFVKASGSDALGALGHTWSLSVEEQFYLLWPLVVVASIRFGRRAVGVAASVGIVASVAFRVLAWDGTASYYRVNYSSISHADGLLLGCLLAVVMPVVWQRRPTLPAGILLAGAVAWTFSDGWWRVVALPTAVAVLSVGLIVSVLDRPGWVGAPWLRWCGRRSYALYLWHYPVSYVIAMHVPGAPWWVPVLVVFTVPFVLAELSWRLVESRFLRPARTSRSGHLDIDPLGRATGVGIGRGARRGAAGA